MIEVENLVKRYGSTTAVDGMSFVVRPGVVTGFLGPNGAGKSTTMRSILGLDRPTSGSTRVNGRDYARSAAPIAEVGALLDGRAFDRGRSARDHLRAVGATVGIGRRQVDAVLEEVGLAEVAGRAAGGFSLGMGQRLGIATALLADPPVVMLDEPANGLDPDGIAWIRSMTRRLAQEGRTVFISSHLMSEMEQTADRLIIVVEGRVLADEDIHDLVARAAGNEVTVVTPGAERLADALAGPDVAVTRNGGPSLTVRGMTAADVGEAAARLGVVLHQLRDQSASLEQVFMELTRGHTPHNAREESR